MKHEFNKPPGVNSRHVSGRRSGSPGVAAVAQAERSAAFTFMKTKNTLGILAAFTFLVGCTPPHRGPAYGHEQEFRRQLADSVPVKDWGFKIQDIRFSEDYYKALVTFTVPGKTNVQETVLEDDGFRRYKGAVIDEEKIAAAMTGHLAVLPNPYKGASARIAVTIPSK
jgi:hypothetical protein